MTPNPSKRTRCVLIGADSLLIQCAEIVQEKDHEICAIASNTPAILNWAREHEVPTVATGKALGADLKQVLGDTAIEYLFSITHLALIPDDVLALPTLGAINFHDGPLPNYGGLNAPVWALIDQAEQFGITYHKMTSGVDEGDIVKQRLFELSPGETSLTLNAKCFGEGIEAFSELIDELATDSAQATPQDLSQRTYFGKFDRPEALCALDWNQPAGTIVALVRALDFGRYENPIGSAKVIHGDCVALATSAEECPLEHPADPGTIVASDDTGLLVATTEGGIRLSGFATARGKAIANSDILSHFGLEVGGRFAAPDTGQRSTLTKAGATLCHSESFWVKRLRALETAAIPYLRTEASNDDDALGPLVPIKVPQAFQAQASMADALICAFGTYLLRIAGQDSLDLAYRHPQLASFVDGLESLVANQVPLRVSLPEANVTAAQHIEACAQELAAVRKHNSFLHDLANRFPDVHNKGELAAGRLLPIAVEVVEDLDSYTAQSGVDLALVITPDGSSARFVAAASALDATGAMTMARQFENFLASLTDASVPVAQISLLSDDERRLILEDWNSTAVDYPRDQTIHGLFEARAAATPDAPALTFEGETLSYAELNGRANQLAVHLKQAGIGPDSMVGVYVERSLDMIVSILGVMKAGGGYIPLDPVYPVDRIAFMLDDSGVSVVLTQEGLRGDLPPTDATVIAVDAAWSQIAVHSADNVSSGATPENLAYMIYTSGSTGKPKGVMVEHRNVLNFFVGMDERIPHDPPGVWLAVTSLSFDISVLELHWTLCRGFHVVLYADKERAVAANGTVPATPAFPAANWRPMDFGIFMWGADDGTGPEKYRLMLEAAKFADANGFSSISTPERHFHAFGGPYPNPSVTSAAIAAVTKNIQIRSGSCVIPLHHPIRVAEEWAVVDNLSNGRVALSMASGWQPNDFVIRPEAHKNSKALMIENIEIVRKLWRGEAIEFENPMGQMVPIVTQPRPVQPELPIWITSAGNPETYRMAGSMGANVLTHLLGQTVEEVAEKVRVYREGRKEAGLDPKTGIVTLMLHTFVGESDDEVREIVREPMKEYLSSSAALVKGFAWAFPAFKRPGGENATVQDVNLDDLSEEEMNAIMEFAFERYFETSGLFGSPETCARMVARVRGADVNEIACLIDYSVPVDQVLDSLKNLARVHKAVNLKPVAHPTDAYTFAAQVEAHTVTHMQCTPSMAKMLTMTQDGRTGLEKIRHLMIGGEAFPTSLAAELDRIVTGDITNMYGPTETTIWSSTQVVSGCPESISIGRPIANTRFYIVDKNLQPVPASVPGELLIGGDGVVRGYFDRPDLTAERFIDDPFQPNGNARLYRTGDLARFRSDGTVDFLGRMDFQVKIRGYRIELGEIETNLSRHASVQECIVIAREDTPGDLRLVAYVIPAGKAPSSEDLSSALRENLPEFMIPSIFAIVEAFPLTPNGKIDRKSLPAPDMLRPKSEVEYVAPEGELQQTIAEVWNEVLHVENIGMDDNFFDLGGHSLLVVQAHRLLRSRLEKPLSLTDLYRFTTIRTLCDYLSGANEGVALEQSRDRGEARRKSMQRRRETRTRGRGSKR